MVTQIIGTSAFEQTGFPEKNTSAAASLGPNQRKQLALRTNFKALNFPMNSVLKGEP